MYEHGQLCSSGLPCQGTTLGMSIGIAAGRKGKLDFADSSFGINIPRFLCKKGEGIYG